jgi:hypothetical protein
VIARWQRSAVADRRYNKPKSQLLYRAENIYLVPRLPPA